jgi:type II restriction enzyme
MAKSDQLRQTRTGTVINTTSKKQESDVYIALTAVIEKVSSVYGLRLHHDPYWRLKYIVENLRKNYPEEDFSYFFETSSIRPDGGILSLLDGDGNKYPILISEVKNQGTNRQRLEEGLKEQAKGNAIERLGKNVIGLRTALMHEAIFPFVCFGYGCDFEEKSSILDRVVTIAMFGKLNTTYLHNTGEGGKLNRGSFYFRDPKWSVEEMQAIMYDIAERSIFYYFSRYGKDTFTVLPALAL